MAQGVGQPVNAVDGEGRLGYGLEQRHLVEFLSGIAVLVAAGSRRRNHHHRRVGDVSRADAVGQIQHPWPVGGQAHAGRSRNAAETVGHQRRPLLMSHADKLHIVAVIQRVQNVQERRPDNPEDVGYAFLFQKLDNRLAGLESLGQRCASGMLDCPAVYHTTALNFPVFALPVFSPYNRV